MMLPCQDIREEPSIRLLLVDVVQRVCYKCVIIMCLTYKGSVIRSVSVMNVVIITVLDRHYLPLLRTKDIYNWSNLVL